MVSSETLVLFSKACELFILELAFKSWAFASNNKRITLQKYDIKSAVANTENFDFLIDNVDDKCRSSLKDFYERNVREKLNTDFIVCLH